MPRINVELDPSVSDAEAKQIENWLINIKTTEWKIFLENFQAFKRSFMDVCRSFAHKLMGWLSRVWNNLSGKEL